MCADEEQACPARLDPYHRFPPSVSAAGCCWLQAPGRRGPGAQRCPRAPQWPGLKRGPVGRHQGAASLTQRLSQLGRRSKMPQTEAYAAHIHSSGFGRPGCPGSRCRQIRILVRTFLPACGRPPSHGVLPWCRETALWHLSS